MVYALGSALPVFTMSLVKSPLIALADSDIQDFSIVILAKTLGSLVGAPLMTVLWMHAIKLGGVGLGLPYFISSVSVSLSNWLLFLLMTIYSLSMWLRRSWSQGWDSRLFFILQMVSSCEFPPSHTCTPRGKYKSFNDPAVYCELSSIPSRT